MCYGETLSAAIVRARKQHRCDDCGRKIEPGKLYHRSTAVDHGDFSMMKICRTCYLAETAHPSVEGEACWELSDGEARANLRQEPWRATLAWMRRGWARALGKEPT